MRKPNIVYILADDMGYGDMHANNPRSLIPTPNLDRLSARGMRFTDAHAGHSVCTPSRYNILTGRCTWRSRLKHGIVWEWDGALIEPDHPTVAGLLGQNGYRTACIGKWHLGWDWPTKDGTHPNDTLDFGVWEQPKRFAFRDNIVYDGRIAGGPVDRGFDSYFGVDVPNFSPYTWFVDDHLDPPPDRMKPDEMYGNPGYAVAGWRLEEMMPEFTRRAVTIIEEQAESGTPFFLYFPLTAPHSPVVPNAEFKGLSGIGNYGDFICEVDWTVGQVMDALGRTGQADNTLLIFTSDNGPEARVGDDEGAYDRARRTGHYSMNGLRGIKTDAWEGGHREPFVAAWPAVIPAGTQCDQLVGLGDLMATCADILDVELPDNAGEDSVSMLPLLKGETERPTRDHIVLESANGIFAIRSGDWVFIDAPSGNDNREEPEWFRNERGVRPHGCRGELFNLRHDPGECVNRCDDRPDVVEELKARLEAEKHNAATQPVDRSQPLSE